MITRYTPSTDLQYLNYDIENRLTSITDAFQVPLVEFVYDGDGGRVKKITPDATTTYIGSLYEIQDTNNEIRITKHIFKGSTRLASKTNDDIIYYHGDHLGSSNLLTDSDGFQVKRLEYEPFGTTYVDEGTTDTNYRFTGKELIDETGLYDYGSRFYDPKLGRFIQPDTIVTNPSDPQDLNRYTYAGNNPLKYTDPSGHFKFKDFFKKIVSTIIGVVVGVTTGQPWLGAAVSTAVSTAMEGGNIAAAAVGTVTGYFGGGVIGKAFGVFWGTAAAGTFAGASSAAVSGGDIGRLALAGVSGGIGGYGIGAVTGFAGLGTILGGGIAAEVGGGKFVDGALSGLAYNVGFTIGSSFAPLPSVDTANVTAGDQVFFRGDRLGKGQGLGGLLFSGAMAILDPGPFNHTGIALGGNRIADSHPAPSGYNGPGIRTLRGNGQFSAYKNEQVAVVKHRAALGVAAEVIVDRMQQAGVTFGGGPLNVFGGGENAISCSEFTGKVYTTSGETGVYGVGPNTQYWYTK